MNANDKGAAACPDAIPAGAEELSLEHDAPGAFALLLQEGVFVPSSRDVSVHDFLCSFLEVDGRYLDERVRTVFLNGLAMDGLDSATLAPGDRLALSGTLPGLAGAVLRRGGFYAGMRESVTFSPRQARPGQGDFLVTVRFFNVVGADLAGRILSRGVFLNAAALAEFLRGRPPGFLTSARLSCTGAMTAQGKDDVLQALAGCAGIVNLRVWRP